MLLPVCLLILAGCGNENEVHSVKSTADSLVRAAQKATKTPATSNLDNTGTALIMNVVTKYYGLKNALVATKADLADTAATQLVVVAGVFMHYLQSDTAHGHTLMAYLDTIINQGRIIPSLKDEHCEKQRLAFGQISSAIYGMITRAGLKNAGIFHQYCPMAFNEKGASWLSDENEIKNPYFGKKMMECGEVTDSL